MTLLPILMDPIETPDDGERVYCPRLGCGRPVCEHRVCLYCFGTTDQIAAGEHARFCDFEPNHDPVSFGFPEWSFRNR